MKSVSRGHPLPQLSWCWGHSTGILLALRWFTLKSFDIWFCRSDNADIMLCQIAFGGWEEKTMNYMCWLRKKDYWKGHLPSFAAPTNRERSIHRYYKRSFCKMKGKIAWLWKKCRSAAKCHRGYSESREWWIESNNNFSGWQCCLREMQLSCYHSPSSCETSLR